MASKKKIPDPELMPDSAEIDAKQVKPPTRKVVETKTVTYDAPADEAETPDEDEDFDFEEKPKRNKPTLKQEKQKLRDRWAKRGIAPTGNLRISLWKFTNEDDPMSGNQADKAFCSKFVTTESAIDDGIHLDAASKFGPGRYWIMIYLNNQIVDQWEFRIAANQQMGQIHGQQMVSMPDPQNPNVIVQMPANQPLPPQIDPMKQFRESLKMMKELREAMGMVEQPAQPAQQNPNLSPDEQMAIFAMKQPDLAKKAIKNLIGSSGGEDEVSWAAVVKDLVTSEQGPQVVRELVSGLFNGFKGMFSGGNNGAPQMAQTTAQNHQGQIPNPEFIGQGESLSGDHSQGITLAETHQDVSQNGQPQVPGQAIRPEDELLAGILDHCKRKMPPKLAADRAMKYAEYIEQIAPHQSIFTILESFVDSPVADSLALLAMTSEEAAEIIKLPHAESWATQLQAELKKAYEPGGVE